MLQTPCAKSFNMTSLYTHLQDHSEEHRKFILSGKVILNVLFVCKCNTLDANKERPKGFSVTEDDPWIKTFKTCFCVTARSSKIYSTYQNPCNT